MHRACMKGRFPGHFIGSRKCPEKPQPRVFIFCVRQPKRTLSNITLSRLSKPTFTGYFCPKSMSAGRYANLSYTEAQRRSEPVAAYHIYIRLSLQLWKMEAIFSLNFSIPSRISHQLFLYQTLGWLPYLNNYDYITVYEHCWRKVCGWSVTNAVPETDLLRNGERGLMLNAYLYDTNSVADRLMQSSLSSPSRSSEPESMIDSKDGQPNLEIPQGDNKDEGKSTGNST